VALSGVEKFPILPLSGLIAPRVIVVAVAVLDDPVLVRCGVGVADRDLAGLGLLRHRDREGEDPGAVTGFDALGVEVVAQDQLTGEHPARSFGGQELPIAAGGGPLGLDRDDVAFDVQVDRVRVGVYGISVAAELSGTGPQNLRLYEARGLLSPDRTGGGTRRYSANDIDRLRRIGVLLDDGLNLAGIAMVLDLETENAELREQIPPPPKRRHEGASTPGSRGRRRGPSAGRDDTVTAPKP
jgi:hypothetical protein